MRCLKPEQPILMLKNAEDYAELDAYVMEGAVYLPIFHRPQPYVWSKD